MKTIIPLIKTTKNTSLVVFLVALSLLLSSYSLAQTQTISVGQSVFESSVIPTTTVAIIYDTSDSNSNLSGLGLRIHYNSSELTFNSISNVFNTDLITTSSTITFQDDNASNFDGDANTDRYVVVAWADSDAAWPGNSSTLPLNLLDISFIHQSTFVSSPINFSSSGTAAGYLFQAVSSAITPPGTDATLSSLLLAGVTISPTFNSAITQYRATVPFATSTVLVNAVTADSNASVIITGTDLSVGDNTLTVRVTAEDTATIESYNIIITRGVEPLVTASVANINALNQANYNLAGTCTIDGQNVMLSISDSNNQTLNQVSICSNNQWATIFDVSPLAEGSISVVASHSDGQNTTRQVSQNVVKDTRTTITAPNDITVEATGILTAVNFGIPTNIETGATITQSVTSSLPLGITEVIWTATDAFGNSATDRQQISIVDTTAPLISVPADIVIFTSSALTTVTLNDLGSATAVDVADGNISTVVPTIGEQTAPFQLPIGQHTVNWSATDSSGNIANVSQRVTIRDESVPLLIIPEDIMVEATGLTTVVELGSATATDLGDGTLTVTVNNIPDNGFPVGTTVITYSTADSDGNAVTASQTITVVDTTAPQISFANNTISFNAEGRFTNLTLAELGITLSDISIFETSYQIGDEQLSVANDNSINLPSGSFTLTVSATDQFNNSSAANLLININPLVGFTANQVVDNGGSITIEAVLSGQAASYPVVIPFTIEGGERLVSNATNGMISIANGLQGASEFIANSTLSELRSAVTFTMSVADLTANVTAIATPTHVVTIVNENIAPTVTLDIIQAGSSTSVIANNANSDTIVIAQGKDANNDSLTYSFELTQNDVSIATQALSANNQFALSGLSIGVADLSVSISDGELSTTVIRNIPVIETANIRADSDGDGIDDQFDTTLQSNVLSTDSSESDVSVVIAELGIALRLGSLAIVEGTGASVGINDLGADTATTLANFGDEFSTNNISLIDYEASGLSEAGIAIRIIIPLNRAIPEFSKLRKYNPNTNQWAEFISNENNAIYTAITENPQGICPVANDPRYQLVDASAATLPQNHWCIQLVIEDGGVNDADGQVNGSIVDPVGVVELVDVNDSSLANLTLGSDIQFNFDSAVTTYNLTVTNDINNVTVSATATNSFATVQGTGNSALVVGSNQLNIVVTALDGSTTTYSIVLDRAIPTPTPTPVPTPVSTPVPTPVSTPVSTPGATPTPNTAARSSGGGYLTLSINMILMLMLILDMLFRNRLKLLK